MGVQARSSIARGSGRTACVGCHGVQREAQCENQYGSITNLGNNGQFTQIKLCSGLLGTGKFIY